jgi:hypothetical protein
LASYGGDKASRLREAGFPVGALSDKAIAQVERLDDDELDVLIRIKDKLNRDLPPDLEGVLANVGVIVW